MPILEIVQLIFYYVGFMALGDVADYLTGSWSSAFGRRRAC